jgi:hypothetical protein
MSLVTQVCNVQSRMPLKTDGCFAYGRILAVVCSAAIGVLKVSLWSVGILHIK